MEAEECEWEATHFAEDVNIYSDTPHSVRYTYAMSLQSTGCGNERTNVCTLSAIPIRTCEKDLGARRIYVPWYVEEEEEVNRYWHNGKASG